MCGNNELDGSLCFDFLLRWASADLQKRLDSTVLFRFLNY